MSRSKKKDRASTKEENVLFVNFFKNEQKLKKAGEMQMSSSRHPSHISGEENPYYLKKEDQSTPRPPSKDLWVGLSATAFVLVILSGATVLNMFKGEDPSFGRGLASASLDDIDLEAQNRILDDLKTNRRSLSSVATVVEKDKFEFETLKSYYVTFNHQNFVLEAQLKSNQTPIYIKKPLRFIEKNSSLFYSYEKAEVVEDFVDEETGNRNITYNLMGEGSARASFVLNQEQRLLSLVVQN